MGRRNSGLRQPTCESVLAYGQHVLNRIEERLEKAGDAFSLSLIHDSIINDFDVMNVQLEEIELNQKRKRK